MKELDLRKINKNYCKMNMENTDNCPYLNKNENLCELYYSDLRFVGHSFVRCNKCKINSKPNENANLVKELREIRKDIKKIKKHLGIK